MARGRVWQGIRDWFRPVDRAPRAARPAEEAPPSQEDRGRIHDRQATRARIDAEGGAEVIPFPGVGGVGAAALEQADSAGPLDPELLDFLAADVDPVPADPAFRERLRDELWDMIVDERLAPPGDGKEV
ncbi:MAG: hypothetical protein AAGC67_07710 [Myxococcota bacterium]